MFAVPGQETIPYHLLFLALGIVYGVRVWPLHITGIAIALTTLVTGWAMYIHWKDEYIELPELVEVPLMPALLGAMVWHARRRSQAQAEVESMAEERAASLVRQREFMRDTCHAIRTPVTIARGHTDLIEASLPEGLPQQDIEVVRTQLDRMSRMSSRLLALAEFDREPNLSLSRVNMPTFIEGIAHHWSSATVRNWRVILGGTCTVAIDPDWVEEALDAVVENALRFTSTSDVIRIECRATGAECIVEVGDGGPGIPPGELAHVFERFWHRPAPDGSSGSGLGLATVLSIARAHGGSVEAAAAPEGGALIRLRFPIQARDTSPWPSTSLTNIANLSPGVPTS